ncbi:wax ester/triacylglycerol synthase domain-containing protein [Sinomonas flava]|uniref:wax ester/triacylglycerol synthase domain-containing protein n=1 Tax=Sinomonas flava TaxID=496857 RepID=UPI0039A47BFB
MGRRPGIDRISSNDLTLLATDRGQVPMHMAAVLMFDAGAAPSLAELTAALGERIARVPRLRRRLVPSPPGFGRPVWVDDAAFSLPRHLSEGAVPGGREDLLREASRLACERLPKDRPLWRARLLRAEQGDAAALVFIAHHVMADGLGGLAVLSALGDDGPEPGAAPALPAPVPTPPVPPFPQPGPTRRELFADAWRERLSALATAPRALATAARGLRELGLTRRRRSHGATTSFNRPTGSTRSVRTVALPLEDVLGAAHARGCTLNDLVLVAVSGALASTLRSRGEAHRSFVVSVPITPRGPREAAALGNINGIVPTEVPADPDPAVRLARVMEQAGARSGPSRGASAGPLGVAFRALARVGVFQHFIDRQRLVTTFLTNVRGPAEPIRLAGHRIASIVPITMTPGNVGVCFAVLSYAGELVISVIADPGVVPEQDELTRILADELDTLTKT